MSEEEGSVGPPPGIESSPVARPVAAPPHDTGRVVAGVFLIGCGLIMLLAGGVCTALAVVTFELREFLYDAAGLFEPVVTLALGILAVTLGIRLTTGRTDG